MVLCLTDLLNLMKNNELHILIKILWLEDSTSRKDQRRAIIFIKLSNYYQTCLCSARDKYDLLVLFILV